MNTKRRKFKGDLSFDSEGKPVDLLAYRLAQRLFWFQAVHESGNDSLQTLYNQILKLKTETSLLSDSN